MSLRTDMAVEFRQNFLDIDGVSHEESEISDRINLTKIIIETEGAAAKMKRQKGEYITVLVDEFAQSLQISNTLREILEKILPNNGLVLVVGLGNRYITPDALGPITVGKIYATRHISETLKKTFELNDVREVAAVAPGVLGQTGIETFEVVKALCDRVNPAAVLIIDALAAGHHSRIGKSLQITNTGIHPGSGVNGTRKEISEKTLGIATIALGVPCVIDAYNLVHRLEDEQDESFKNFIVAPTNIDEINEKWAEIIAHGINMALKTTE